MPYEFMVDMSSAGYALESKRKGDATVHFEYKGLYFSDQGEDMFVRLDGISKSYLSRIPLGRRVSASAIDHLLVIERRDKTTTVYINELVQTAMIRPKRDVKKGEELCCDDVLDIHRYSLGDVAIPSDAGVTVVISSEWRKALFFDFGPLIPKAPINRDYDIELVLAQMWAALLFRERFVITPEQWEEMHRQGWFPFANLNSALMKNILTHATEKWQIDDLLDEIEARTLSRCDFLLKAASKNPYLSAHRETVAKAVEAFRSKQYLVVNALLYPRLEGILRSYHFAVNPNTPASTKDLLKTLIADPDKARHDYSLLLPRRFHDYMSTIVFGPFEPNKDSEVSRHTVAHGIAPETKMDRKAAVRALLVLDQVCCLMQKKKEVLG